MAQYTVYTLDSCEYYDTAGIAYRYESVTGTPMIITPGRTSIHALSFDGGGNHVSLGISDGSIGWAAASPPGAGRRFGAWGASVYVHSAGWGATPSIVLDHMRYVVPLSAIDEDMAELRLTSAGALSIHERGGALIVQSADGVVPFDTWCFIEFAVNYGTFPGLVPPVTANTGEVLARVDNVSVASATAVSPGGASTNPGTTRHRMGNRDGGNTVRIDICDIYAHGGQPTNVGVDAFSTMCLGYKPVRCYWPTRYVSFAPTRPNMTPVGAATNLECISDAVPDGDTTYVRHEASVDDLDAFYFDGAPALPIDLVGSNPLDFGGQADMHLLGRAEVSGTTGFVLLTLGTGGGSQGSDAQMTDTYFYLSGGFRRRPPSFNQSLGYERANNPAARCSQFVLDMRGAGGAHTWIAWLGT